MNSIQGHDATVLMIDDHGVEIEIKGVIEASIGGLVSVSYDPKQRPEIKGAFVVDEPLKSDLEVFASALNPDIKPFQSKLLETIERRLGEDCPAIIIAGAGPVLGKKLNTALMALGLSAERASKAIRGFHSDICIIDDPLYGLSEVIKLQKSLHTMPSLEDYENEQPRNRDHGWYRKFDKQNGKRNRKLIR